MAIENTKHQKAGKIKKPLTGIQAVASILEVRVDTVSRVITGQTLCTPERVQMYKDELKLIDKHITEYILKRKESIRHSNNVVSSGPGNLIKH